MLRGVLSIAFAAFLLMIVLGVWKATGGTPERAMWDIALIGIVSLIYASLTGFSSVRHSTGQGARVLFMGLVFSFLPLLVAVYSIAVWQYSPTGLTTFQIIAVLFGGLAALLDVVLFSWLSFRQVGR